VTPDPSPACRLSVGPCLSLHRGVATSTDQPHGPSSSGVTGFRPCNMIDSTVPAKRKAGSSDSDDDSGSYGTQSKARKRVPTEEWESMRPIITRLYQEEKRSLKDMMLIMERDYHFVATLVVHSSPLPLSRLGRQLTHCRRCSVKMYKSRIWKWGLDKKLKGDEVLAILLLKRDRDALNKPSEFRIRGQLVDFDNIKRYVKRNPSLLAKMRAGHVPNVQTTREVTCRTPAGSPEPTSLVLPSEAQNVDEVLRLFRDYVDGSFSSGSWHCEYDFDCVNSQASGEDRSNELFERVLASFALVNRCMMKGDKININSILGPCFESLKEIVAAESPEFVARTVCLLWYLDRHHKHDLLRLVLDYLAGLIPIVLGQHHILAVIWRRLSVSRFSDYHDLSVRLYSFLLPEMEERAGAANFLTHLLYSDYIDCVLSRQGPEECEATLGRYLDRAEASGKRHPWLDELALSYAGLLAACKENQGRPDEAVEVLTNHLNAYDVTDEQEAALHVELGGKYYRMGNVSAAVGSFQTAARIALTSGADERLSMTALTNLESMLELTGELARAERIHHYRRDRLAGFARRSACITRENCPGDVAGFGAGVTAVEAEEAYPEWLWHGELNGGHSGFHGAGWIEAPAVGYSDGKGGMAMGYEGVVPVPVPWPGYSPHAAAPEMLMGGGLSLPGEMVGLPAHDMQPMMGSQHGLDIPRSSALDNSTFVFR
jgi:Clr5-like protein